MSFSPSLQSKIDQLAAKRKAVKLGSIDFASPLLLAPMSAICNAPFRLLMEELGAGGTVSELVSCHGINYKNEKTLKMLYINPSEQNVGLQLFGEDTEAMAKAATVACEVNDKLKGGQPKFIDINMGCPVRKVVTKGGGSALLQDTKKLAGFFNGIKKAINLPLTIKIRTGWDSDNINADEVVNIAKGEGVEFVAVHGRTRAQHYKGLANWDYLENLAQESPLPIIGNGDLHTAHMTKERLKITNCPALMLGRGPLRNPFIFLESFDEQNEVTFTAEDYLEVITRFVRYLTEYTDRERTLLVQTRKMIVWFAAGFPGVATFRGRLFETPTLEDTLKVSEDYFLSTHAAGMGKQIDHTQPFMAGGHG